MPRADAVPALLSAALIVVLGFDEGGYAPASWVWAAALLVVAGVVVVRGRPARPSMLELAFLGGLAGLLVWSLLSAWWSLDPTGSILEAQRLLLYLATAAALVLVSGRGSRQAILLGTLAGLGAVCLAGIVDVVVGDDPVGALTADPGSEARLSEPVGYANALALMAAMGVLISLGLALAAPRRAVRIAYLAAVPLFAVTLYLTYSRGGWLALAVGLVAMLALRLRSLDRRVALPLAAAIALAAVAATIVVVRGFDSATTTPSAGASRLATVSGSNRAEYWRVAWRDVGAHPVVGSGAGSWGRYWLRERPVPQPARDAHSLFLETLAELGPLGLGLLLVAFAAPVVAAIRTRGNPLTPAALGPFAAYAAHAAQDWVWEVPAATVPALLCAVALLARARRLQEPPLRIRTAGAVVTGVLAVVTLAAYAGNRALEVAETGSETSARRAARLQPWSGQPWRVLGEAQLAGGNVEAARRTFLDAIDRDDGDWELWLDLALASEGAERQRALARAAELNPLAPELEELRGEG
jgi:O-antigen ligase